MNTPCEHDGPERADEAPGGARERSCPECDYNLSASCGRCPSCGWEIDEEFWNTPAIVRHGRRAAVVLVAAIAALAILFAAKSLFRFAPGLRWRDAATLLAVGLGAAGHLVLAAAAVCSRNVWPMRRGEASAVLLVMGLASVAAGMTGATSALALAPTPLFSPTGVQVNGIFEFVLTAMFFTLPGLSLLILRLVSFREPALARRAAARPPASPSGAPRAPFTVSWWGAAKPDQVDVRYAEQPRPSSPDVERLIAQTWDSALEQARAENRLLYDAPLVRLNRWRHDGHRLHLDLGLTSYRDFVGTHFHNAGWIRAHQPEAQANALGVSVLPLTRDGQLVLGRRGPRVARHEGWTHPFGGMVEPADRANAGVINVFLAARRELGEELAVPPDQVSAWLLVALVRDADLDQPELIFEAALAPSATETARSFERRGDHEEHDALCFIPDDPESLAAFLHRRLRLTPVAQAALLLHGRRHFGEEWYDQNCLLLYGNLPDRSP